MRQRPLAAVAAGEAREALADALVAADARTGAVVGTGREDPPGADDPAAVATGRARCAEALTFLRKTWPHNKVTGY